MNPKKIISFITVGVGAVTIGLGLQYASASWITATSTPPNSNTDAPINVGGNAQSKTGLLALANLAVTNMNVASGTVDAAGSVLTNDGNGNASWSSGTVPSGAVMAFDLSTCPTGWSTFTSGAGRTIIGSGAATASTSAYTQGSLGGYESVTLTTAELPAIRFLTTVSAPTVASGGTASGCCQDTIESGSATGYSDYIGSSTPISIMQPYIVELYCQKN